jgi:hypothetical protein
VSGRGTVCRFAAIAVVLAWAAVGGGGGAAAAERLDGFGIVLMLGKGGQPGGPLSSLAAALEAAGAHVIMPSMAWSGKKGVPDAYDTPYEQALDEITRTIARHDIVASREQAGALVAAGKGDARGNYPDFN